MLGPVDRALGFGFGALKGLIFASLLFLLLVLVIDTFGGGPARAARMDDDVAHLSAAQRDQRDRSPISSSGGSKGESMFAATMRPPTYERGERDERAALQHIALLKLAADDLPHTERLPIRTPRSRSARRSAAAG